MGRALAVLIWLITLLSVWLFVGGKWWFPPAISEHGPAYDRQFLITIIVVGVAFVAAQVGLGLMLWQYGSNTNRGQAIYTHGNNRLEVIWTVITAAIFIGLAVAGQSVWASLHFRPAPADAFKVHVVAQQFQWNFHYPGKDGVFGRTDPALVRDSELNFVGLDEKDPNGKDDTVVSVLAVPVNRATELTLRAKDVTHSFWVPELRFKQDLVPGMEIKVHFTPVKTGRFELACAELCGQLHYKMKSYLLVLPQDEHAALMALGPEPFKTRIAELMNKYPIGQSK